MEFYNQSGFQSPNVYPSTNTASYNYNPYNYSYPGGYQPHYYKPDNSYSYYPNSSTTSHNDSGYEPSFYLTASPTAGQYAHSASFQSNQFNSSSFFESSPTSSGLADSKPKLADSKRGIVDVADESLTLEDSSTTQATNSTKRQRIAKLDNLNNRDTTYRCVKCFRDFNSAARFLMHQHRVHLKRSSTECPICNKTFGTLANTMVHLKAHTQEKAYPCQMCKLSFCDTSTLRKHLRTHTGERPYECNVCHKRFTQSGNLKRHMVVHEAKDDNLLDTAYFNQSIPQHFNFATTQNQPSFYETYGQQTNQNYPFQY